MPGRLLLSDQELPRLSGGRVRSSGTVAGRRVWIIPGRNQVAIKAVRSGHDPLTRRSNDA